MAHIICVLENETRLYVYEKHLIMSCFIVSLHVTFQIVLLYYLKLCHKGPTTIDILENLYPRHDYLFGFCGVNNKCTVVVELQFS